MEIIIIINGTGKRYDVEQSDGVSDTDFENWLFSELEQSELKPGNKMGDASLGKLKYICDLKRGVKHGCIDTVADDDELIETEI